jgi:hypothetical protein
VADFTLTADGTGSNDLSGTSPVDSGPGLLADTFALSETSPAGYTASAWVCVGGTQNGANITVGLGESATCTITNDDIAPQLRVIKLLDPTTDLGLFNLLIDAVVQATDVGHNGTTGFVPVNAGGHTVSETAGTGTVLSDYVAVIGGDCAVDGTVTLALAESKTCTITNTKKGMVQVEKTILGAPITGTEVFKFELRQDANATDNRGTLIDTATANSVNGGSVMFAGKYVAGDYQFCEVLEMPGWSTSLSDVVGSFFLFNPGGLEETTVCVNFTLSPGETETFTVDNRPPPDGPTLTIGFWKNHSSCKASNGHQTPELDTVIESAPAGITIGLLTIVDGDLVNEDNIGAVNCNLARNILDKRTAVSGVKMADDPFHNMAAQLLAAKLNVQAQAMQLSCANQAIADAQALLVAVGFDGETHGAYTPEQAALANELNGILDAYNNGTLVCPPAPTPLF